MADASPDPDSNGDSGDDPEGTPCWVYVSGIIAVILVLLFLVVHLTGGGLGDHNTP